GASSNAATSGISGMRAPPTGQVRNEYIAAEVEFGFVEDNPAARAPATALERTVEFATEARCGTCVMRRRTR
ncbi:MAG: hypothetical protein ACM3ZE_13530, partial [Myxococcales bacterium]